MLFNSYIFIFLFLPVSLSGFYLLGRYAGRTAMLIWLVGASLLFYSWWNPAYIFLLLASVTGNFIVGSMLIRHQSKPLLIVGLTGNLLLLGYYKYTDFFIGSANTLLKAEFTLQNIILPLAISFFTFQQIAYLVDAYKKRAQEPNFLNYTLFVVFFPQLIAGPIVHHKEVMPQFAVLSRRFNYENFAVGISIFVIGLFKKVVIGDSLAGYANPIFDLVDSGVAVTSLSAWQAASAFLAQIYFDFSGYSDMAIGLARLFGVRLPANFNSPYKASNFTEFWNRWHVTLSRFLRQYVFLPLTRHNPKLIHANVMITMLLAGLWHGASWNFVLWGGFLGAFILINNFRKKYLPLPEILTGQLAGQIITILLLMITIVFFRADSFTGAMLMIKALFGFDSIVNQASPINFLWIALAYGVTIFAPNTQEIMRNFDPVLSKIKEVHGITAKIIWSPSMVSAFLIASAAILSLISLSRTSQFIYFQF